MATDKPSTALVPKKPTPRAFSLLPSSLGEAMEMAKLISESDFAPKDYKGKPGNVMIAIQMGADVGLKPMQSLQNIAVINGRPSIWGDAAIALVQSGDILERFHETIDGAGDARTATCIIKRKNWPDEIKRTFSVSDAKRANLWGKAGPWTTYPDRMLQMRARGFALRDAASDRLMGLILAEEAMDYPDAIDGTVISSVPVPSVWDRIPEPLRDNVEKAFETLALAPAIRLVKLNEYLGGENVDPDAGAQALLMWCRDEFAKRKTGQPVARTDNGKKHRAANGAPTEGLPAPGTTPVAPLGAGGTAVADPSQPKTEPVALFDF